MKNNKVLMSLVAASIAAMAAAPELLKSDQKDGDKTDSEKNLIDLNSKKPANLTAEQQELSKDVKNQVGAILNKKTPIMKVSESVSILVDNYGSNDESVKEKIYKDLQLAVGGPPTTVGGNGADSVLGAVQGTTGAVKSTGNSTPIIVCHSACHSACHTACHGARGWR